MFGGSRPPWPAHPTPPHPTPPRPSVAQDVLSTVSIDKKWFDNDVTLKLAYLKRWAAWTWGLRCARMEAHPSMVACWQQSTWVVGRSV